MMFVVVNRVAMPPSKVAKASGIRRCDKRTCVRPAMPETAGKRIAAAAMLFIKSESNAPITSTATSKRRSLVPAKR